MVDGLWRGRRKGLGLGRKNLDAFSKSELERWLYRTLKASYLHLSTLATLATLCVVLSSSHALQSRSRDSCYAFRRQTNTLRLLRPLPLVRLQILEMGRVPRLMLPAPLPLTADWPRRRRMAPPVAGILHTEDAALGMRVESFGATAIVELEGSAGVVSLAHGMRVSVALCD